jgi:hypothetical protein
MSTTKAILEITLVLLVIYYIIAICILLENMFNKEESVNKIKTKKELFYLFFPFPLLPSLFYQIIIIIKSGIIDRIKRIKDFFNSLD